jgi:hypothetical protein
MADVKLGANEFTFVGDRLRSRIFPKRPFLDPHIQGRRVEGWTIKGLRGAIPSTDRRSP